MRLFPIKFLLISVVMAQPLCAQTLYVPGGTVGNISGSNVGVGTTSPRGRLHVNGDLKLGVGYGALSEVVSNAATILGNNVIAGAGTNTVTRYFDDPGYGTFLKINNLGLTFHNVSSQTYATEVSYDTGELFRITSGGNVGIGTTAPGAKLDVVGEIMARDSVIAYNSSNEGGRLRVQNGNKTGATTFDWSIWNMTGGYGNGLAFWRYYANGANAGPSFWLGDNGNIGIGTTAPDGKLNIMNAPSNWTANGWCKGLRLDGIHAIEFGGGATVKYGLGQSDDALYFFDTTSEDNSASAAYRMVLRAGNVGIGTTNPTQKLSVNGAIRAKEVIVDTSWSDYVFKPDYVLASLSEVEGVIKRDGHLPGIPSAQEVAEHGVSMGEMQSKLLAKIEELTLHQIALEKENRSLQERVHTLEQRPE
jgi:hypothetical protein